ncbi:MAG: BrnA antitoxin family protein [Rhodothermales bacterium]
MPRYQKELTPGELAALKDEDIDFSDIPATDEAFWKEAVIVQPQPKKAISLRLDADVLAYFQQDGPGYQTRINAVLKAYVETMRSKSNPALHRQ